MERPMSDEIERALNEVIAEIRESSEYQKCIELKEQMNKNSLLMKWMDEIKEKQKKYVKSNFKDKKQEQELIDLEKRIREVPLFVEYNETLERVNEMIDTVKEQLNDYFQEVFNILK